MSELPLLMLPLVATVLAVFFEVDNSDEPVNEVGAGDPQRQRVAGEIAADDAIDAREPESERVDRRRASHKLQ